MTIKHWNKFTLAIALILTIGAVQGELFKSLEYGLSFDYEQDLKPDVIGSQGSITLNGPEDVSIILQGLEKTKNLVTIEDLAKGLEMVYRENMDPNLEILGSENKTIDGNTILEKEYLLNLETDNGQVARKYRNIYLKNDDYLIYLSCRANDYYYSRANQMYFAPLIDSLNIFPINQVQDKCISGFPKYASNIIVSSPLMVDINGDGSKEIIVGTYEGKLHAWNKDGAELNGFPFKAEDKIGSSPAMGDINGDKKNEIVFGSDDGMLYVLNGNGSSLPGFPKATEGSIRSSPALGDLNGDGSLEIVVGSLDTGLYSIGKDGSIVCGFPVITGSSSIGGIYSSPALGDIDGDGSLDIAIGETKYEEALSSILGSRISSGRVFAVNGKGEAIDGFPDGLGIGNIVGFSSPVLADINGDGSLEIMVGSADGLHCLDAKGVSMPGFPVKTDGSLQDNFIAVGDLDGDGKLEIVSGCTDGRLYVWRSDGSAYPGFPIQTAGFLRHMTLGDIDKDGKQEILGGSTDNRVHAWKLDGSEVAGFPKVTLGDVKTAPTLGDLNGDGSLELAVGSNDGSLYVWKISQSYGKLQWPMIQQNPEHTGVFKQS